MPGLWTVLHKKFLPYNAQENPHDAGGDKFREVLKFISGLIGNPDEKLITYFVAWVSQMFHLESSRIRERKMENVSLIKNQQYISGHQQELMYITYLSRNSAIGKLSIIEHRKATCRFSAFCTQGVFQILRPEFPSQHIFGTKCLWVISNVSEWSQ